MRRISVMNLTSQRITASLHNLFIGDALSMPVHWFYRTSDIIRFFPPNGISKMEAAPHVHPSSIMSLHSTEVGGRKRSKPSHTAKFQSDVKNQYNLQGEVVGDIILKGKRDLWGESCKHYHDGLLAGDNTLNACCARLMVRHLVDNHGYNKKQWLEDYIRFMTQEPAQHPDTYAESYHRSFFANLKNGKAPDKCGASTHDTPSIGALVSVAPLAFAMFKNHTLEHTQSVCCEHVHLTHPDSDLMKVVCAYVELLHALLYAEAEHQSQENVTEAHHSLVVGCVGKAVQVIPGTKLNELLHQRNGDSAVVGGRYSTACYITDSWPAVCYLTAKYYATPGKAMLINTNLGGENAHRGSVLGTLVGLGSDSSDAPLFEQLKHREAIAHEVEQFVDMFGSQ